MRWDTGSWLVAELGFKCGFWHHFFKHWMCELALAKCILYHWVTPPLPHKPCIMPDQVRSLPLDSCWSPDLPVLLGLWFAFYPKGSSQWILMRDTRTPCRPVDTLQHPRSPLCVPSCSLPPGHYLPRLTLIPTINQRLTSGPHINRIICEWIFFWCLDFFFPF